MKDRRYNGDVPVFAEEAGLNFLAKFNTDQRLGVKDWQQIANEHYKIGWETRKNETPTKADFNGVMLVLSKLIKHVYDSGIPEYNSNQTYYINSYCLFDGTIYKSLQDNNKGNGLSDKSWWMPLYDLVRKNIDLDNVSERLIHKGFIQDYYGEVKNIPAGWYLCDGENDTPDLRGMFIVGYDPRDTDYKKIGNKGGDKTVGLTVNQMPTHDHQGGVSHGGEHTHFIVNKVVGDFSTATSVNNNNYIASRTDGGAGNTHKYDLRGVDSYPNVGKSSSSGGHSHGILINKTGGNEAHENRPPYYVLMKIMYKGT